MFLSENGLQNALSPHVNFIMHTLKCLFIILLDASFFRIWFV